MKANGLKYKVIRIFMKKEKLGRRNFFMSLGKNHIKTQENNENNFGKT